MFVVRPESYGAEPARYYLGVWHNELIRDLWNAAPGTVFSVEVTDMTLEEFFKATRNGGKKQT